MKHIQNGSLTETANGATLSFQSAHLSYELTLRRKGDSLQFLGQGQHSVQMSEGSADINGEKFKISLFEVSGSRSSSRTEMSEHLVLTARSASQLSPKAPEPMYIVSTSEFAARQAELTGGKGSSLAVLTALAQLTVGQDTKFEVPNAIVLTVNAYAAFSKQTPVANAIKQLQVEATNASGAINGEALRKACERCEDAVRMVSLAKELKDDLATAMCARFGPGWTSRKFAVRSSAIGEDSEDMSAAGQMTTYLAIQGQENIEDAIVKCWASQFAFTAVQYRRQYGEPINSRMAVVVQEMAEAQAAGVMFTCEPVTGNPLCTAITANLGLGESVVSGMAEPDTFLVDKTNDECVISQRTMGAKACVIVPDASEGTLTRETTPEEAANFCIDDEVVIRLAKIGVAIDKCYGTSRDIEWAIGNGEIFILQCRPVTSVLRESDYEIRHDLNSALRSTRELLSRANYEEVMPGCVSPIAVSTSVFYFDNCLKYYTCSFAPGVEFEESPYCYLGGLVFGRKWYQNYSDSGCKADAGGVNAMALAMFGRDFSKEEAFVKAIGYSRPAKWYTGYLATIYRYWNIYQLPNTIGRAKAMRNRVDFKITDDMTACEIIDAIIYGFHQFKDSGPVHLEASFPSMSLNLMILYTLAGINRTDVSNAEIMSLFARLMKSNVQVESVNIPASIGKLSISIRNSSKGSEFAEMSDDDALKWLQTSEDSAACSYREFLVRHGHRGYKEFDVYVNPWEMEPLRLIRSLKASVVSVGNTINEDDGISLDELPVKPSFSTRLFLNWLIPRAKYAVYAREQTKTAMIYTVHKIRLAVRALGRRMELEGRLPFDELVHFFTLEELYRLLHDQDSKRNHSLVTKAILRHRLYPTLNKEKFEPLICGMPTPMHTDNDGSLAGVAIGEELAGTPVSEGVVVGPARVIHDFDTEVHLIKKGDILVAHGTDTCWTPYFPLLAGVITQIGGFLSHGAVVAREFGLPAVVGVKRAEWVISTGDMIRVDGSKGIVTILKTQ